MLESISFGSTRHMSGVHTVVAQKGDDEVVTQRHQVHSVAEEVRDLEVRRNERQEQKL